MAGVAMVRVTGDVCVVLQYINSDNKVSSRHVHRELVGVKVNRGLINRTIEELDKLEAMVSLMFRIIID